jgi:biotin transport system substrate-specific component
MTQRATGALIPSIVRRRKEGLSFRGVIVLALSSILFAVFTGLCARLRLFLPFTPVPVTGQVFAVLLSGVFLGAAFGAFSQILYVCLGIMGVDWFVLGPLGPTWGYIVGFILAPVVVSMTGEVFSRHRRIADVAGLTAGILVIYSLGLLHFTLYTGTSLAGAARYAVLPFIPFDAGKVLIVFLIAGLARRWSRGRLR